MGNWTDNLVVIRFPSQEYAARFIGGPHPGGMCLPVVHDGTRKTITGIIHVEQGDDGFRLDGQPGRIPFEQAALDLSHDMGFIYGLRWLIRYTSHDRRELIGMARRWLKGERVHSDTERVHELLMGSWHPKAPA